MGLSPVKYLADFLPVVNLLKANVLHRRAGHYHSVIFSVTNIVQRRIEFVQVAGRGVQGHMALHIHKGHVHLQGRVRQRPQQLQLRVLLYGHIVQNQQLQGTYVLMHSPAFVHDKYIFVFQNLLRRQIALCSDRHILSSFRRTRQIPIRSSPEGESL